MNILYAFLLVIAHQKAAQLQATDYLAHSNRDGCTMDCRIKDYKKLGYHLVYVGENLYRGSTCDWNHAMEMWYDSPAHRAILYFYGQYEVRLMVPKAGGGCYGVLEKIVAW